MVRVYAAAALFAALVAACGDGGAPSPGGVSEGEAKALEEAASMLDERQLPPEALPAGPGPGAPAAPAQMSGDTAPAARQ